jgi:outer membrane protein assembly factor BamD (BamD/ComL family)
MKNYTIEDIKAYFKYLVKRYPNSDCADNAKSMMFRMFDSAFDNPDNFEKVIEKLKREAET